MYEFRDARWMGGVVKYNFEPNNNPAKTVLASACLTNGCTYHLTDNPRWSKKGVATYDIWLRRDLTYLSSGWAYWCPFTLGEVIKNLEDINEIIPFKFEIIESPTHFKIHLEIDKKEFIGRIHFYVLTRVRYLWEYPQCVLYKDALRLSEKEEFSDWNLQDLYNLVVDSMPIVSSDRFNQNHIPRNTWYDPYHSIPKCGKTTINKRQDNETLKKSVLSIGRMGELNQLYKLSQKTPVKIPFDEGFFNSLVFWAKEEGFNARYPFYLENKTLHDDSDKKKANLVDFNKEELTEKLNLLDNEIRILSNPEASKNSNEDNQEWLDYLKDKTQKWNLLKKLKQSKLAEKMRGKSPMEIFNILHPRDSFGRFIKRKD